MVSDLKKSTATLRKKALYALQKRTVKFKKGTGFKINTPQRFNSRTQMYLIDMQLKSFN